MDGSSNFHLCSLCSHCLCEPVTLTCGCTFCKACWAEYVAWSRRRGGNSAQCARSQACSSAAKRKMTEDVNEGDEEGKPVRCPVCARAHEHNTLGFLRPNVTVVQCVDKMWSHNVEIRRLRNDARAYACHCIQRAATAKPADFDINLFDYLFNAAYTLDPSNHLILADLFILNYFYDCNQICLKYAQMACDLRPSWAFVSGLPYSN